MSPGLCACYKCVVSGRRWNLVSDFFLAQLKVVGILNGQLSLIEKLIDNHT